jgi:hypothetical protein
MTRLKVYIASKFLHGARWRKLTRRGNVHRIGTMEGARTLLRAMSWRHEP